jgi:phenylacetate-CoA ligase
MNAGDVLDVASRVNLRGVCFNENDIVLIRFPYAISSVAHFMQSAAQMKNSCVVPASSRTTVSPFKRIVDLMIKLGVTVLAALPQQAVLIAETAELLGLDPGRDFPSLRAVYTAGEVMSPGRRKSIEEIWGVPVYDNYGMTEIGPAAASCEYGIPHPFEDNILYEVLDEGMQTDVPEGETGNLVVTTLTRQAVPLVRYITGDRARLVSKACRCGERMRIEIKGRQQDTLRIGSSCFDTWDMFEIVSRLPCRRFWAAGPFSGGLKLVAERQSDTDMVSDEQLERLKSELGINLYVEIVPKGTLYDRSELCETGVVGKPRYIYSEREMLDKAYIKTSAS